MERLDIENIRCAETCEKLYGKIIRVIFKNYSHWKFELEMETEKGYLSCETFCSIYNIGTYDTSSKSWDQHADNVIFVFKSWW